MFLRVLAFYLITMVFSGGLNSLQSGVGLDTDLIQRVQFAPALAVGVMFLLFRRTTGVQVRFQPAGEVAVRSAVVVAIVAAAMLASVGVNLIAGLAGVWVVAAAVTTHLVTRRRAVPTAPPQPALTV